MHKTLMMTAAVLVYAVMLGRTPVGAQGSPDISKLPDGPGKTILQSSCTVCHGLDLLSGRDEASWKDTVDRMIAMGADVKDDQVKVLVDYLTKNFPPEKK
jgi:cytochrome c5